MIYFAGPILILLVGLAVWWLLPIFGKIEPENAPSSRVLLWIALRDLDKQSDETLLKLTKRVDELYGRHSEPKFKVAIPKFLKSTVASELAKRKKMLAELNISPSDPNAEVPKQCKARIESNIVKLIKTWYVQRMRDFDNASILDKPKKMDEIISDLKWWNALFDDAHTEVELAPLTLTDKSKNGDLLFLMFRKSSSPDEYNEMVSFKGKILAAFVVSEAGTRVQQFFQPFFKR